MKETVSVFLLVVVLVFSISPIGVSSESPTGDISVVVLGDSISRGYGLDNVEKERFSSVLSDMLKEDYASVSVSNFGVDGITGKGLLQSLDTNAPQELSECDYVIVSIGGNNILQSLSRLESLRELAGGIDLKVFIDYFRYLTTRDENKKQALDYARETINMLFRAANDSLESEAFANLIKTARDDLYNEIPAIVSRIREINKDAKIIIQTVYNPYKGMHISLKSIDETLDLSSYGEMAVAPLNEVIESLSAEYGYTVAPVRDAFEASSEQLTNAGFDLFNRYFGVDPHPNAMGHSLIAEIHHKLITEE